MAAKLSLTPRQQPLVLNNDLGLTVSPIAINSEKSDITAIDQQLMSQLYYIVNTKQSDTKPYFNICTCSGLLLLKLSNNSVVFILNA